jgi:hypothetical protein
MLQLGGRFPVWRASEHNLQTLLHFIKSIFFFRNFEDLDPRLALNPEALKT